MTEVNPVYKYVSHLEDVIQKSEASDAKYKDLHEALSVRHNLLCEYLTREGLWRHLPDDLKKRVGAPKVFASHQQV